MGTRGYYAIKYKHIYYIFYNSHDSYFSYLGINLLIEIRNMLLNGSLPEWITKIQNIKLYDSDDPEFGLKYDNIGSYENMLDIGYMDVSLISNNKNPVQDLFIEYVYLLDIENEKFIINNQKEITFEMIKNVKTEDELHKFYDD
jgi:hypothetical protein